jgi:hypothetical protein
MYLLELRTSILGYINRPSSEMASQVNSTINLVLRNLQRGYQFQVCETLVKMTYPGGKYFVNPSLEGVTETIRNIISVGVITNSDKTQFMPAKPKSFTEIVSDLNANRNVSEAMTDNSTIISNLENLRRLVSNVSFAYFGNKLVLYPTPSANVELLLHCSVFFPALSADTDSNALTDAASDYIIVAALRLLHIYMKVDVRYAITDAEVKQTYDSLLAWDRDLRTPAPIQ